MNEVSIKSLPRLAAVSVEHIGPYTEIKDAFDRLFGWLNARNLSGTDIRMFGAFYDDPAIVAAGKLHSRAAAVTEATFDIEPPLERTDIGGGEYAVLRYKGPYDGLMPQYDHLYKEWLPKSGRQPGRGPSLEEYLNDPGNTPPSELLTDIFIPLA
ncbi:MAG: GyrI-like domain-containing protein [bacterium]